MNATLKALLFLLAVAAVSITACLLTGHWLRRTRPPPDMHAWIHRRLDITPEQDRAIEAAEERFAAKRRDLLGRIHVAHRELAQAMLEAKGPSPRVKAAIEKAHRAHAELQQATIDHVFEMRSALRPDQYDKLLNLTANALNETSP